jgi:hypothetical protein
MGTLRPWVFLLVLSLPAVARAGDHRFDAFLAGSYLRAKGSNIELLGPHVSGAFVIKGHWLSVVGDLSWHVDSVNAETGKTNQFSFLGGPRITVPERYKFRHAYLHLIIAGLVRRTGHTGVGTLTAAAAAIGAGVDFPLRHWSGDALRIQVDYVRPWNDDVGRGVRISMGYVLRFHDHPRTP